MGIKAKSRPFVKLCFSASVLAYYPLLMAAPLLEVEANDSIAAAQNLDGSYSLAASEDILHAEILPHVSVIGTGNNTYDYYHFSVAQAGTLMVFDIDYGANGAGDFDAFLSLWDASHQALATDDDTAIDQGAGGSSDEQDSYLMHTFAAPGSYYIRVGSCCDDPVDAGGTYTLQVSHAGLDVDDDGMPDIWEQYYGLNDLLDDAELDSDDDSFTNYVEYLNNSAPNFADTDGDGIENSVDEDDDGDGLSDVDETNTHGTNPLNVDSDNDDMPDGWEVQHNLNPLLDDAGGDADADGLSNIEEYQNNTHPDFADTDGDGIANALDDDDDGDGLSDVDEASYGTDPLDVDSDNDRMPDGWEVLYGLDPTSRRDWRNDPDGDNIRNRDEYLYGSDPTFADTDGDGIGNDEDADDDGDGLNDADELSHGTDALEPDSDNDGMSDGWEVQHGLQPLVNDAAADADNDKLSNLEEFEAGGDPNVADTDLDGISNDEDFDDDGDGLADELEATLGTDPLLADTDDDRMPDGWEVQYGLDPLSDDADLDADADYVTNVEEFEKQSSPVIRAGDDDEDGLNNETEALLGSNPHNPDSDGDQMPDRWEVAMGLDPLLDDSLTDEDNDGFNALAEFRGGSSPYIFNGAARGLAYTISEDINLIQIDLSSGVATVVGPLAIDADFEGLAFAADGTLFAVEDSDNRLYRINTETGRATFVGNMATDGTEQGLAFDAQGQLWMVDDNNRLYRINAASGQLTIAAHLGKEFDALTWAGGKLYAMEESGVYEINPETGASTFIVSIQPFYTQSQLGLSVDDRGNLLGLDEGGEIFLIDPLAKTLRPYVRSENVGAESLAFKPGSQAIVDSDSDGLADQWEEHFGLDKNNAADAALDSDADGLSNRQEYYLDTHPKLADSDGDGAPDGQDPWPLDADYRDDMDADGIADNLDLDIDGDGFPNIVDAFPTLPSAAVDADEDGWPDDWNASCDSACQANPGTVIDADASDANSGPNDVEGPMIVLTELLSFSVASADEAVDLAVSVSDYGDDMPMFYVELNGETVQPDGQGHYPLGLGEHQLTWFASDKYGNQSQRQQQVIVTLESPPSPDQDDIEDAVKDALIEEAKSKSGGAFNPVHGMWLMLLLLLRGRRNQ